MKTLLTILTLVLVSTFLFAQVPNKISYQGLLTTSSGTPVQDGSYDLKFEIFNLPSGGTSRHVETQSSVPVSKGTFSLALGPLPAIFSESLYVEVTALAGPGISSPITFSPRSVLTSAPYSLAPWSSNNNDIYYNTGNVGIGVSNPTQKLEVNGDITASKLSDKEDPNYFIDPDNAMNSALIKGSVGIGITYSPTNKLDVNGNIKGNQLISTVASGTPPLSVSSSTMVSNLNAEQVNGASVVMGKWTTISATPFISLHGGHVDVGGTGAHDDKLRFKNNNLTREVRVTIVGPTDATSSVTTVWANTTVDISHPHWAPFTVIVGEVAGASDWTTVMWCTENDGNGSYLAINHNK